MIIYHCDSSLSASPALSFFLYIFFVAATSSAMAPLGLCAPDFSLIDVRTNATVSLQEHHNALAYVIAFICNHCPYVVRIQRALATVFNEYAARHVACFAISANDAESYPADSPEVMRDVACEYGYQFPYLYDETQQVARAYDAVCTPDFFVFNVSRELVYRGQFDASRPHNDVMADGTDICHAIDCVLAGKPNMHMQVPSVGCNIKWKNA